MCARRHNRRRCSQFCTFGMFSYSNSSLSLHYARDREYSSARKIVVHVFTGDGGSFKFDDSVTAVFTAAASLQTAVVADHGHHAECRGKVVSELQENIRNSTPIRTSASKGAAAVVVPMLKPFHEEEVVYLFHFSHSYSGSSPQKLILSCLSEGINLSQEEK